MMDIKRELIEKGFIFLPEWNVNKSTHELAMLIGAVVSLSNISGLEFVSDVQKLIPREKSDKLLNQYSGNFGLDVFPLHSDLAHWSLPPKYFMLRCLNGYTDVLTNILPFQLILEDLMILSINKAVVKTRSRFKGSYSYLLPLIFNIDGQRAYRWDSLFLEPVNSSARKIKEYFAHQSLSEKSLRFKLSAPGDTLIINNWINLHGRSRITDSSIERVIERIYLNEVY